MRTDAKIGFAIGGVLLAVLTVYAIVVPKHKKTTGTVSIVNSPTGADTPAPAPLIGTPDGQGQPPATPVKDAGQVAPPHNDQPPVGPIVGPNALDVTPNGGLAVIKPQELKPDGLIDHPVKKQGKTKPAPFDVPDDASGTDRYYTIQAGQTLSKIAYEVYGNARFYVAIQRENRGLDANHLKVGSRIRLPEISPLQPEPSTVSEEHLAAMPEAVPAAMMATDGHSYIVKSGDNLYAISRRLLGSGRKADALYALNKEAIGPDKTKLRLGTVLKLPEGAHAALAE